MMDGMKFVCQRKYTDIGGYYNEARQNQKYVEAYEKELEKQKAEEAKKVKKEKAEEREM